MINTTPSLSNRQWIYRRRPEDLVGPEHYEQVITTLDAALARNEVLIEVRHFSVDPYMRIQQAASTTWDAPHPLDAVQGGAVVGRVLESMSPTLAVGDWVSAYTGWQTHAVAHANDVQRLDPAQADPITALGVLGMPGRTAWFGLMEAGAPKPGDVVVVSAAAGAVGSLVVQFAKRAGATVVGIAGGAGKCDWLRDTLGADIALDYRELGSADALGVAIESTVGAVDVYFDNVGGWISDAILARLNLRARVIICGQISQYSGGLDAPPLGPRLLQHLLYQRASIRGILARDYAHRMDEMRRVVAPWVADGSLCFEVTRVAGFDALPSALRGLFTGEYRGKVVVDV